ncbi:MAG: hypothetical protein QOD30_822 [Actinomycetota bacterium]|nr:hypothetical protein [Actinomycetota bacterium]
MNRRTIVVALLVAVAASGCVSTPKDRSTISLRRANLALAFTDPSLAEPAPIEVVRRVIPAPALPPAASGDRSASSTAPPPEMCPAPPDGARPEEPAILKVATPRVGTYTRINSGTITLSSGTVEVKLPYPPMTEVTVQNVHTVDVPTVAAAPTTGNTVWTHWEVVEELVPGVTELIEYRADASEIDLVRRETTTPESENGTTVFRPNPPVEVLALASPGTTWQSIGIDTEAKLVRAVSGTVGGPTRAELCGQVVEAIPASVDVQNADLGQEGVYGTDAGKPLEQDWLPQYGALIARQALHQTEYVRTKDGVVKVTYDVRSKLQSTEPQP